MTPRELLAHVRQAQGLPSNYALARVLGMPDTTLQRWNTGSNAPDDATAARLAEMAGLDPDVTVAAMHAARAHSDAERARWERIARRLQVAAAGAFAAILSLWITGDPDAGAYLLAGVAALPVGNAFDGLYIAACCVAAATLVTARRPPWLMPWRLA